MKIAHTENMESRIIPGYVWNLVFKLIKITIVSSENLIFGSGSFNAFYAFNYSAANS